MKTVVAGLGLGLIGVCTLIFVALHFLDTGLDPVEHTLSEYALSRVGWLFPVAVFAIGAAAVLLAVGLRRLGPPAPTAALALLVVFAVAMALTGIARTDAMDPRAGGFAMSTSGSVHATAGLIAIVALCVAAPMLTGALVQRGSARAAAEVVGWLPTFGAAVFVTTVVAREPIEWLTGRVSLHGIDERFGFGGFIVWLAYATLTMLTELLDQLAGIQETVLIYPSTGGRPKARRMLTETNPTQDRLAEIFDLKRWAPRA